MATLPGIAGSFAGNRRGGVLVQDAPGNFIGDTNGPNDFGLKGGNNIQDNAGAGVHLLGPGAFNNTLIGNAILNNGSHGVLIDFARNNTIGGPHDPTGNVFRENAIAGNLGDGIHLVGVDATRNTILGNLIGVVRDGFTEVLTAASNNNGIGIENAPGNTIGGLSFASRNILSGNTRAGIRIEGPSATENLVFGNFIGTNLTGTAALPNQQEGVLIVNAANNDIGGTATNPRRAAGFGNLISGNRQSGVFISGPNARNNRVSANRIGVQILDDNSPLPNRLDGLRIAGDASENTIGGTSPGEGNLIRSNLLSGVAIQSGTANVIQRNRFGDHFGLGIDLGPVGVTNNDLASPPDLDAGGNDLQNFPILSAAGAELGLGANIEIRGTLISRLGQRYTLDFYLVSPDVPGEPDVSGQGEGTDFFGSVRVTTDAFGTANFVAVLPNTLGLPPGRIITATATDSEGNTSEFSANITLTEPLAPLSGDPNQPPVASDDEATTDQRVAVTIDVLDNDDDPNGDTITLQTFTQPALNIGTVEETDDGRLRFTPAAGFSGEATFTYTIGDSRGGSDEGTVTITVNPNAAPVAVADTFVTRRNTATTVTAVRGVLANDTDANLDPLTAAVVDPPDNGQLTLNTDGGFVYSPNNNFAGTDTFTYKANDGSVDSQPTTVTVQVLDDNAAGLIVNGELRVHAANTNDSISIKPVGTNLQVTLNGRSSLFALADVQSLRVNASGGNDTVTVDPLVLKPTVLDGGDGNDRLPAGGGNSTLLGGAGNDTLATGNVLAANATSIVLDGGIGNDTLNASKVAAAVAVTLIDGLGNDSLTGHPGNTTFVLTPGSADTLTDPNGLDTLDFSDASAGVTLDLDKSGVTQTVFGVHTVKFTGVIENFVGSAFADSLTVDPLATVTRTVDGGGGDDRVLIGNRGRATSNDGAVVAVTGLAPVNHSNFETVELGTPIANDNAYTAQEDKKLTVSVAQGVRANDTDPDGLPLTITVVETTEHGVLTLKADGSFTYQPNLNFNGTDTFTYQASDGALSDTATVTITVTPVADAPLAVNDLFVTTRDAALNVSAELGVLANDSDPDGNVITAAVRSTPKSGTLTLNANGSLTYMPKLGFTGLDSFTYRASDGALNSKDATVTITVLGDRVVLDDERLTVTGTTNADTIRVSSTNATLSALIGGKEIARVPLSSVTSLVVNSLGGNDNVTIDPNVTLNSQLDGGNGDDQLTGGGGNSTLIGGSGKDTLRRGTNYQAGEGDDKLFFSQGDTLDGGTGNDSAFADEATAAVTLDLTNANLELVQGSRFDDTLDASAVTTAIKLLGKDGNDTLLGGTAHDTLDGGTGSDSLNGGTGADTLTGGVGDDELIAGPATTDGAIDRLSGDAGNDTIRRHLIDLDLVFFAEIVLDL